MAKPKLVSSLPASYRHAIKNQYIQHFDTCITYAQSGHFRESSEAQIAMRTIFDMLGMLCERDFLQQLRAIDRQLSEAALEDQDNRRLRRNKFAEVKRKALDLP